jgi:hypothetical protein
MVAEKDKSVNGLPFGFYAMQYGPWNGNPHWLGTFLSTPLSLCSRNWPNILKLSYTAEKVQIKTLRSTEMSEH